MITQEINIEDTFFYKWWNGFYLIALVTLLAFIYKGLANIFGSKNVLFLTLALLALYYVPYWIGKVR